MLLELRGLDGAVGWGDATRSWECLPSLATSSGGGVVEQEAGISQIADPGLSIVWFNRSDQRAMPPAEVLANDILDWLEAEGIAPALVRSAPDGSVLLFFEGDELLPGGAHRRYGTLECGEEGDVAGVLRDRADAASLEVWDVPSSREAVLAAVERILAFLRQ